MKRSVYHLIPALVIVAGFFSSPVFGAPKRHTYEENNPVALRELRNGLNDLRHEMDNHESEIHTYGEKFKTLELALEALRDQFREGVQSNKELAKGSALSVENKILSLETANKTILSDLRQFKTYATESTTVLAQYKQKIAELEKIVEQQNQNMEHLQSALRSLMDLLQAGGSMKTYKVVNGDSLEKIARKNQTSIKILKELNGLAGDKITVGQVLKLPEN